MDAVDTAHSTLTYVRRCCCLGDDGNSFLDDEPPGKYPFVLFRTSPKEENRHCAIIGYAINRNINDVKHNIFSEPIRVIQV